VTGAQAFVVIDRLEDMKDYMNEEAEKGDDKKEKVAEFNDLALEDVHFSFPDDSENDKKGFNLSGIDLKIRRGEKVAVVGKIASGKTTLLNLVSGIYEPEKGEVLLNGKRLDSICMPEFREKIGFIQQEPIIFSESVYTNIDFWREHEEDWVHYSSGIAQFRSEVEKFPGGFNEKIGQRGVKLSGGQRQRLSISRAVCGSPELLLMDDVTSALDAENEMQFWEDLFRDFPDITCLIVTHRISTAQKADRIIVLDEGRIEAEGDHAELMRISPTYKELAVR
ncbi:MAG: ATP-binding cassette domain-containing protein, partial [Candidatus Muiribacteriaceae bacterium]